MRKRMLTVILLLAVIFIGAPKAHAVQTRLRVAYNYNQAPYHFRDDNGNPVGMHIDMLDHIAKNSGLELQYYPMDNSTEMLKAMNNGDIDIIIDIAQKYRGREWMSVALSEETVCTVADSQRDGDERAVTTYQVGTISPSVAVKMKMLYSIPASDQKTALDYLLDGRADVMLGLKESVLYYLSRDELSDSYTIVNNYMGMVGFSLVVPENDYALLYTINRGITDLRVSEAYNEIRMRWSYQESEEDYVWLRNLVLALVITVIVVGLYAITLTVIRRALKRQVDKQTFSLKQAGLEIQQQMEQLKAESEIRNRIIRYSHLGMVLFDGNYTIMLCNDSAVELAGGGKQPEDIRELRVFGDIVRLYTPEQLFSATQTEAENARILPVKRGDREVQYRYSLQRLMKSGQIWAILLVVEDITDEESRRHMIFEEEKSKMLNQIVASIAHEIKNPLTAIATFTATLKNAGTDPGFMDDFLRYVPAEVERINRLVEGLIGYAKPAAGVMESLDLTALVWEAAFFARNSNRMKQIRLVCQIEDGHRIVGSRDQIKQVLINLILNGMESMQEKLSGSPEGTSLTLTISLGSQGEESVISVRDEGQGMSPELIKRGLDPFFTTKRTGTGLGLTLSQQYTRKNNGRMTIDSQVGVYTEIRISFRRENYAPEDFDR